MFRPTPMPPAAKAALSRAIRELRELLLRDVHAQAEAEYRLSVPRQTAGLPEAAQVRRERLEAWIDEQARTVPDRPRPDAKRRFLLQAESEAAYTLLHRLVVVRHMEALGLSKPALVDGGRGSPAYKELQDFAPGLCGDPSQGYAPLLRLLFDELALDLPGLFGPVGLTELFTIPPETLHAVVETLDRPALAPCWEDDTTLGWVYQYYNDPERERLDAKLHEGGKVEPHEIASKTQMFTERYLVQWLLHNSLGPMWLAMCRKQGWTPEVESEGVLAALEARRIEWRALREAEKVKPDALMPVAEGLEERWAYYVPQPLPSDAIDGAPDSVRELRILDPACGSGHFLVLAFDLLLALYQEEARHRHEEWSDEQIVRWICEDNLHGVDIDPRAVQIAAAALLLKARSVAPGTHPERLNLVASRLELARLPKDDPAAKKLRDALRDEAGLPERLTNTLLDALADADHLGTLLQVDAAVEAALADHETRPATRVVPTQQDWLRGPAPRQTGMDFDQVRNAVHVRLEEFLDRHTRAQDLGLRLGAQQVAAGVRFLRIVKEDSYHLVIGNPPYQGTSRMVDAAYVAAHYPLGKADLYAAFLERCLQLTRPGGTSALLTMRNWMFLKQYEALRRHLLETYDLRALGDVDRGAFAEVLNDVLATCMSVFRRTKPTKDPSVAVQPTPISDTSYDGARTGRKRAALVAQVGRYEFEVERLRGIGGWPVVYWWPSTSIAEYVRAPKLREVAPVRQGMATSDNPRFLRQPWEPSGPDVLKARSNEAFVGCSAAKYVPYVRGAAGRGWQEPLSCVINWHRNGLEQKSMHESRYGSYSKRIPSEGFFFTPAVSYNTIGNRFFARSVRFRGIFDVRGSCVFPESVHDVVAGMNTERACRVLESLNPGMNFQVGDVNRLPLFPVAAAADIFANTEGAFAEAESARETSLEFRRPGPSPWRYAQDWAQRAVDRPDGAPLPPYDPVDAPPKPVAFVSFALGVALGRFDADGEGILDEAPADALPDGILYLSTASDEDDLAHPACKGLHEAWTEHGAVVAAGTDLRTWLRESFFEDVHRQQYENRPIWWPLSSAKRSFVAWVAIHRMGESTLSALLTRHLIPERVTLEGRLDDLRRSRTSKDRRAASRAEEQFPGVKKLHEELCAFIDAVEACGRQGPPQPDPKTPAREVDARYVPDLDDGVMINSAALWPLLAPQWSYPKVWWKELVRAKGRKDYDWSHLAMRYFPTRVDAKCQVDPSLGVAHGCFWKYHPQRAYTWELRLQDEIGPDFRIEEVSYRGDGGDAEHRTAWLREHTAEALVCVEKEAMRRRGRGAKRKVVDSLRLLDRGLWSREPRECWELEMGMIAKQGADFRLLAPDEPECRRAFEAEHPQLVAAREEKVGPCGADGQQGKLL